MPTKKITSKTMIKNIRFSYGLLKQIEQVMEKEKTQNFSAWVKQACREKVQQYNTSKDVKNTETTHL